MCRFMELLEHFLSLITGTYFQYVVQYLPFALLAGGVFLAARYLWVKRTGQQFRGWNEGIRALLVCYCAGIFQVALLPPGPGLLFTGGYSFVPTFVQLAAGLVTIGPWIYAMFALNTLMFVPVGLLLPFALRRNAWWRVMLICLISILAIEAVQPIVGRSGDADDLLCNLAGSAIGFGLYKTMEKLFPAFVKKGRPTAPDGQAVQT